MTYDEARMIGFDTHAYGLAKHCVHWGWCTSNRVAWHKGWEESAAKGAWGRYQGLAMFCHTAMADAEVKRDSRLYRVSPMAA